MARFICKGRHVRDAISSGIDGTVARRRLDDAVDCALNVVVAPSCEQVSRIDNAGILDGRGIDKCAGWTLHLQATSRVLEEQRNRPVVTMCAGTYLARIDREDIFLHLRVVGANAACYRRRP